MNSVLHRIGLVGDVHAESGKLQTALRFLAGQSLDAILCTGDVCDGPGDVNDSCQLLDDFKVFTVRGNHDRWLLEENHRGLPKAHQSSDLSENSLQYLTTLPHSISFETEIGKIILCHGVGDNDMAHLTADDYGSGAIVNVTQNMRRYALSSYADLQSLLNSNVSIMIGGHTHRRIVHKIGSLLVINPGTLLRDHAPCVATVDFNSRFVQFHDFEDDLLIPNCRRINW